MVEAREALAAAVILLAATFAGCIGTDDAANADVEPTDASAVDDSGAADGVETDTGTQDVVALEPDDTIQAPSWEVGQWFGYHVFFGPGDDEGVHYDSVVIEEDAGGWTLAPTDPYLAAVEAAWDLPVLGTFSTEDLSTTNGGEAWSWYRFPLEDGATWTETFTFPDNQGGTESYEVTFEANYTDEIALAEGSAPGFEIDAVTSEGNQLLSYDYVPEIGWFAHLFIYDPSSEEGNWTLHLMTMGQGIGYSGEAYTAEATPLVEHVSGMAPLAPSADPNPHDSFTVSEAATHVYGFAWSFAWTGAHETVLVDPNDEVHEFRAVSPLPTTAAFSGSEVYIDAVPGEWQLATVGAGGAAFGGANLWELVQERWTLEDGTVQERP